MNTTEDRFTAEQIMEVERRTRNAAHSHEYSGTTQQAKRYRETAAILRQAASDTARIAELTAWADQMASWIVRHGQKVTDHACAECLPDGEILIPGFRCGWHTAIARNALKETK